MVKLNNTNDIEAEKGKVKSQIIVYFVIGVAVIAAVFGAGAFQVLTSDTLGLKKCPYLEESATIADEYRGSVVKFEADYILTRGQDPDSCTPMLGSIQNTIGERVRNWKGERVSTGTEMAIVDIVVTKKYGIRKIDSGDSPLFEFVMRDTSGGIYKMYTGWMEKDSIARYEDGIKVGYIDPDVFYNLSRSYRLKSE